MVFNNFETVQRDVYYFCTYYSLRTTIKSKKFAGMVGDNAIHRWDLLKGILVKTFKLVSHGISS